MYLAREFRLGKHFFLHAVLRVASCIECKMFGAVYWREDADQTM
jgi:hypothetical protein